MFVLWYCYKRGREVRLEQEKSDAELAAEIAASEENAPQGEKPTETPAQDRLLEAAPATSSQAPFAEARAETQAEPVLR